MVRHRNRSRASARDASPRSPATAAVALARRRTSHTASFVSSLAHESTPCDRSFVASTSRSLSRAHRSAMRITVRASTRRREPRRFARRRLLPRDASARPRAQSPFPPLTPRDRSRRNRSFACETSFASRATRRRRRRRWSRRRRPVRVLEGVHVGARFDVARVACARARTSCRSKSPTTRAWAPSSFARRSMAVTARHHPSSSSSRHQSSSPRVRARWVSPIDVVVDDRTSRARASRVKFSRQSSMGAASLDVARRLRHRSIDRSIGDVAVARTTSMRDASRVRS